MREYDLIAEWYGAVRSPEAGVPAAAALAATLSPGSVVLDLGCGDGFPIAAFLLAQGFSLVGLDSSAEMIARFRARFPVVPARCEPAQTARIAPGSFDAVVAWGVLFHLTPRDQAAVIARVSRWLRPGGRFVFTSGVTVGTVEGEMNGVGFRYTSLGETGYAGLLEAAGMRLTEAYQDEWENDVYVAVKGA